MIRTLSLACLSIGLASSPCTAQVNLALASQQQGTLVRPGATISWQIVCVVDAGNLGLAGISVDLVHGASNPAVFDIPASAGVPAAMAGFSRPAGISNPGPGGTGTGYVGTQVGQAGSKDLVEIGGMQNTVGGPGSMMGQDSTISASDQGIGQQVGGQVIAEGFFSAPFTPGSYSFDLASGLANVFVTVGTTGQASTVRPASVTYGASLSFTVGDCCSPDFDGDGDTATDFDIQAFFACVGGNCCPTCRSADFDCDGDTGTDFDFQAFFRVLGGGAC